MAPASTNSSITAGKKHSDTSAEGDSSSAHWASFYENFPVSTPSLFARFIRNRFENEPISVVDLGCGNLRDSHFFACSGWEVLAVDQIDNAALVDPDLKDSIQFLQSDISDSGLAQHIDAFAASIHPQNVIAYGRFILHAMNPKARERFLDIIFNCNDISWYAFEFRTIEDEDQRHLFEDHRRYFVDMLDFLQRCSSRDDCEIVYQAKNTGLAPFEDEDPMIGRVILKRKAAVPNTPPDHDPASRQGPQRTGPNITAADISFPSGRIEGVGEHEISGWAAEAPDQGQTVVTLHFDGLPIMSVRTNLARPDLEACGLRGTPGFRFPISAGLRGIARAGAEIEVFVAGTAIPPIDGVRNTAPFGAQYNDEIMRVVFANGFVPAIKHGALYRPISARENFQTEALDAYRRVRTHLQALGQPDFLIAFGSLLGLERDGRLIGHDDDFDGLVVIEAPTLEQFLARYRDLLRALQASDCQMEIYHDGLHFSLVVGGGIPMDSFIGWFDGHDLLAFHTVLPCAAGDFTGVEMAGFPGIYAPACTERLLEHWYGSTWRIPDPYFQWDLTPEVRARFDAFAGQVARATGRWRRG